MTKEENKSWFMKTGRLIITAIMSKANRVSIPLVIGRFDHIVVYGWSVRWHSCNVVNGDGWFIFNGMIREYSYQLSGVALCRSAKASHSASRILMVLMADDQRFYALNTGSIGFPVCHGEDGDVSTIRRELWNTEDWTWTQRGERKNIEYEHRWYGENMSNW